jgi:alanyl aminopeptidase
MARNATTELTYDWLKENDEQVLSLIPEMFRSNIAMLGGYFCDASKAKDWSSFIESHAEKLPKAKDWSSFIESHAEKLPGYERELAMATERIHLCSALREARSEELLSTFASYQGSGLNGP